MLPKLYKRQEERYSRIIFDMYGKPMINPIFVGCAVRDIPQRGMIVNYLRSGEILGQDMFGYIIQNHGGSPHKN